MSRKIRMTLDPQSISRAIREVERYENELKRKINLLLTRLAEDGANIARVSVAEMNAVETGALLESIQGYFDPKRGVGIVEAGSKYAIYVEFGTGVVGEGTYTGDSVYEWVYDINGHGEDGWTYFNANDGRFYHTTGQVSRPFMSMTARELSNEVEQVAMEVFGR